MYRGRGKDSEVFIPAQGQDVEGGDGLLQG